MPTKKFLRKVFLFMGLSYGAHAAAATPIAMSVTEGGQQFVGSLYLPAKTTGKVPLVLVVPEWWGKNAYSDHRAEMVASQLGAAALSVDVYGDGKLVDNPKDAMSMAKPFYDKPEIGVQRLNAFLRAVPAIAAGAKVDLDMSKIVAIGYCFGGSQVLNLARAGEVPAGDKLVGVVSFHGGLASALKATKPIAPKLLVLHGEADKMVNGDVAAFKSEMIADKASMKFVGYPNAQHAFTNPESDANGKKFSMPVAYNAAADKGSWAEFKKFFAQVTK